MKRSAETTAAAAGALLVLVVAPAALAAPPDAAGKVMVIAVKAVSACFSDRVRVTGFTVPHGEVFASIDGDGFKVTEVLVQEGERVKTGQVLAKVARMGDPSAAGAAGRPPAGAGAAPPTTSSNVLAPAAGTVTRRTAVVGAFASPQAEPLFRIALDGQIELDVEVPSTQMAKLKVGQPARVAVENGPEINGRIRIVGGEIEQRTQMGRVRLLLDEDPSLRAGMFARATIDAARSCGVSVPRSAIFQRTDGTSVQVIRDGVVATRQVQIGLLSDFSVEIRLGLKEGDLIVATAGTSLHDGDQVQATMIDEAELKRGL